MRCGARLDHHARIDTARRHALVTRSLAKHCDMSQTAIARVWKALALIVRHPTTPRFRLELDAIHGTRLHCGRHPRLLMHQAKLQY